MRIALALVLFAAACGSKKPPQAPAPTATEQPAPGEASEERDQAKPDDPDEMPSGTQADPCDGGE